MTEHSTAPARRRSARTAELVSVIMAVHNGSPWISDQLDSLAAQDTDFPWEVIVVNDRSTDDTEARVSRAAGRVPGLRIIPASERPGKPDALRVGIAAANGDLLVIIDADDVCPPGWLQAMTDTATTADAVGGAVDIHALNSTASICARPHAEATGTESLPETMGAGAYPIGCATAMWRSVWEVIDDPSLDLPLAASSGADRDLGLRLRRGGFSLAFCAAPPLLYRLREPGPATRSQLRGYGVADAAIAKRYQDLGAHGDPVPVAVEKFARLVPRAIKARLEGDEAHWARSELALAIGRVEGSIRSRHLCL